MPCHTKGSARSPEISSFSAFQKSAARRFPDREAPVSEGSPSDRLRKLLCTNQLSRPRRRGALPLARPLRRPLGEVHARSRVCRCACGGALLKPESALAPAHSPICRPLAPPPSGRMPAVRRAPSSLTPLGALSLPLSLSPSLSHPPSHPPPLSLSPSPSLPLYPSLSPSRARACLTWRPQARTPAPRR